MNLSLKKRIAISFIIANVAVLVLSFVVFHFLHNLNKNIESVTTKSIRISSLTHEVRISTLQILKTQGIILVNRRPPLDTINSLRNKLKILKQINNFKQDIENKPVSSQISEQKLNFN